VDDVQVTAHITEPHFAVQVGCSPKREKTTTVAMRGHFRKAGVQPKMRLAEFKVDKKEELPPTGMGMRTLSLVLFCLISFCRNEDICSSLCSGSIRRRSGQNVRPSVAGPWTTFT
jgi:hypothetical protein